MKAFVPVRIRLVTPSAVKRKVNGEDRVATYAPADKLPEIIEAFDKAKKASSKAEIVGLINDFIMGSGELSPDAALEVLRQFGLVDNQKLDHFLAAAFAKRESGNEAEKPGPALEQEQQAPKVAASDQAVQSN